MPSAAALVRSDTQNKFKKDKNREMQGNKNAHQMRQRLLRSRNAKYMVSDHAASTLKAVIYIRLPNFVLSIIL